jgi:hypothetical protein
VLKLSGNSLTAPMIPDIGIRKVALQSAATFKSPTIVAKLRQIAET